MVALTGVEPVKGRPGLSAFALSLAFSYGFVLARFAKCRHGGPTSWGGHGAAPQTQARRTAENRAHLAGTSAGPGRGGFAPRGRQGAPDGAARTAGGQTSQDLFSAPPVDLCTRRRPFTRWRRVNATPSHRSNRVRATRTTMPFSLLALVPGTRIGVYDITTQIGAGGMGEAGKLTSGGR